MKNDQTAIPCALMRGGTSRGAYFLASDLPEEPDLRDNVLLAVMGGPDSLQVDGLGGGHPLTSKVAVVGPSGRPDADVDYLFLQVVPGDRRIGGMQNCGNILAGVGPFAVAAGLVPASGKTTRIRVHMINSGNLAELSVNTSGGTINYGGDTAIDGVPGTGQPVICDFLDVAGSVTGSLLPTGHVSDVVDGVTLTCIDNGMPVAVIKAEDIGASGYESPDELDENGGLKAKLETLRIKIGPLMNLGDVADKTVPKMCIVAKPAAGGAISTRTFIPHVCHRSIGVLGAVTVATACLIPGSVAAAVAQVPEGSEKTLSVEHPSGSFGVRVAVDESADPENLVKRAGVVRTARMIMQGRVFVPASVWSRES